MKAFFKSINEDEGVVESYVSVYGNVDLANEVVVYGAFQKSLEKKLPKGVYMHDWSRPISTALEIREIEAGSPELPEALKEYGGLYAKQKFYKDITDSWQTFLKIKNGLIDEYSIGYEVKDYEIKDGIRHLKELELFEFSPVLVGANRMTLTQSVKGLNFNEHLETAGSLISDVSSRVAERLSVREKAGRTFSSTNVTQLLQFAETVIEAGKNVKDLVQKATAEKLSPSETLKLKFSELKNKGLIK